jgi:predicted dehydrogenase
VKLDGPRTGIVGGGESLASDEPVRVGVAGLGYWGPNLVRNLHEIPAAEAAWMCDLRPETLAVLGRRFPAVRQTREFDEMLEDEALDAVAIVTPVATHCDLAMRALEAGKHVFVEKPLAPSSDEARILIRTAYERGLVLMPGHTFLYSPPVVRIRDLIRSGELGEIYFVSMSRVNLGLHQSDVSVTWDLGPHDFSILLYWLGEGPRRVVSMGRACIANGQDDVAFINCEFDSGTIAHIELSWLAPSKLRRTTVVGSTKMVLYDDCSNEPVRVYDSGVMPRNPESFGEYLKYRTGDIVSPHIDPSEPIAMQMEDFCHAIRTGSTPRSSAHLGLEVVYMIEAAERSLTLCSSCANSTAVMQADLRGAELGLLG